MIDVLSILWDVFSGLLMVGGILIQLLGLLVFYHVFIRSPDAPADTSNRINSFRLFWFAITRQELFVGLFPWLKNDELDNMEDKG